MSEYVNTEAEVQTAPDVEPEAEAAAEVADSPAGSVGEPAPSGPQRGERKTRQGYVVSDKMDKTVVVEVEDRVKHPLYGKVLRRSSKVKAHDEANSSALGDRVLIMETRPLSATKRWRVVQILEKAK